MDSSFTNLPQPERHTCMSMSLLATNAVCSDRSDVSTHCLDTDTCKSASVFTFTSSVNVCLHMFPLSVKHDMSEGQTTSLAFNNATHLKNKQTNKRQYSF